MNTYEFITGALHDLCDAKPGAKVLDLGCGAGALVRYLREIGFDAWGCDSQEFITQFSGASDHILQISTSPYRLPAEDSSFDAVISTSVFEHVTNKDEVFREIYRILKPGGAMMHLFPSKHYLPTEPHIFVPFVTWMWPNVPKWWLALWAIIGRRNHFQQGLDWRETYRGNVEYCKVGLSYWPRHRYRKVVTGIFGNCTFPNAYYVKNAQGGTARLARKIPAPSNVTGWILTNLREVMLFASK